MRTCPEERKTDQLEVKAEWVQLKKKAFAIIRGGGDRHAVSIAELLRFHKLSTR